MVFSSSQIGPTLLLKNKKKGNMYMNAGETWGAMILERRARREVGHNWGIKMSLQN